MILVDDVGSFLLDDVGPFSNFLVDRFWMIFRLVVSTPLKNISQLGWLFPIYGKIKNVPNHQPVLDKYSRLSRKVGMSNGFFDAGRMGIPKEMGAYHAVSTNGIPKSVI